MANPKGAENVSSCVPETLAQKIGILASQSGLSRSSYVRALLEDAATKNRIFRLRFQEFVEETGQFNDAKWTGKYKAKETKP